MHTFQADETHIVEHFKIWRVLGQNTIKYPYLYNLVASSQILFKIIFACLNRNMFESQNIMYSPAVFFSTNSSSHANTFVVYVQIAVVK